MPETLSKHTAEIEAIKADLTRSTDRLLHVFSFVPDDKLNWSPSPTSRTAVHLVAHCALTNNSLAELIHSSESDPFPEDFFKVLFAKEKGYKDRDVVVQLLRTSLADALTALDNLKEGDLERMTSGPMGPMPVSFWASIFGRHLVTHIGQLEYLQTIWGDEDFHF